MPNPYAAHYRAALTHTGGMCPMETGAIGRLADNECKHGRLPGDRTPKCGCWLAELAPIIALPGDRQPVISSVREAA